MTAGWVVEGVVELGGCLSSCGGIFVRGIDLGDFILLIWVGYRVNGWVGRVTNYELVHDGLRSICHLGPSRRKRVTGGEQYCV